MVLSLLPRVVVNTGRTKIKRLASFTTKEGKAHAFPSENIVADMLSSLLFLYLLFLYLLFLFGWCAASLCRRLR